MTGMDDRGMFAFGRATGQKAADTVFDRAFAAVYAMAAAPGKPLLPTDETTIRAEFDELMKSVAEELINDLKGGTAVERSLFLETVRTSAVEHFMARLKEKWEAMVTQ